MCECVLLPLSDRHYHSVKCLPFWWTGTVAVDVMGSRWFCSTFVWQIIFSYEMKLSSCLSGLWIKTVDVWLVFWIETLCWFFTPFAECGIVIWEPVWLGSLCVSRGHDLLCGNIYCLQWYSWSPIAKPGQQAITNLTKRHICCCICPLHGVYFFGFYRHVCMCGNKIKSSELACVCVSNLCAMVGDCR